MQINKKIELPNFVTKNCHYNPRCDVQTLPRLCTTHCLMQYEMNPSNGSTVTKWCTEKHSKKHKGFFFFSRRNVHCQYLSHSCPHSLFASPLTSRAAGQVRLQVHLEHIFKRCLFLLSAFVEDCLVTSSHIEVLWGQRQSEREWVRIWVIGVDV